MLYMGVCVEDLQKCKTLYVHQEFVDTRYMQLHASPQEAAVELAVRCPTSMLDASSYAILVLCADRLGEAFDRDTRRLYAPVPKLALASELQPIPKV